MLLKRGKGGAIIEEIQNGYSIKYQYNISGQRTQMESCFGAKVQHAYDPLGQLLETQAGLGASPTWTAHFEYDVMGRESLRRLLGGVESRTRYDPRSMLPTVTQGVGYEVSHRSYDWDLSGKLRKLTAGSYTAEFDYDVVGTLATARYNETDILYKNSPTASETSTPTASPRRLGMSVVDDARKIRSGLTTLMGRDS